MKNRCERSTPMYFLGIITLLFVVLCCHDPAVASTRGTATTRGQKLKIMEDKEKVKNVFYCKKGRWHNLTRFDAPHEFFAYKVSPSNRYAYVWHLMRSPRVLSIYDLQTMQLLKEFEPGFGGDLQWNRDDNIVHTYGCGSGCMVAKVYSTQGKTLFSINGSPVEISPSGRFVARFTINWVGAQSFELYDLSHKHMLWSKLPLLTINSVGHVNAIQWGNERTVVVKYTDAEDSKMKESPWPDLDAATGIMGGTDTPEVVTREILATDEDERDTKYFERVITIDMRKYTAPRIQKTD